MSTSERGASTIGDQSVDVRRYVEALRRAALAIGLVAVIVTLIVMIVAETLPKTYEASARLIYNPSSSLIDGTNPESTQRQLATYESLVRAPTVIASAAGSLHEPASKLKPTVSASADPTANILSIKASAGSAKLAAQRANAVAQAFVTEEQDLTNRGYASARGQLEGEIAKLRPTAGAGAQIAALEARVSELQASATGIDSELQLAESATPPSGAASPRIAVDGLITLIVALLLGVFVTLARDQLRPHFVDPRELGTALGLPVLAGIPYRPRLGTERRRRLLSGLEYEAYNLLRTSVRLLGQSGEGARVILVTSAIHGEGKTTVTASLGRSLARGGQKTLVVSGDMRSPTLHQHFGMSLVPGLSDCLAAAQDGPPEEKTLQSAIRTAPDEQHLDVLVGGEMPEDPSSLAWGPALGRVIEALREMDYEYILFDSPPILGIADGQLLTRYANDVLVVARLDRISPYQSEELGVLFKRMDISPIGVSVVGARVELSPYYYTNEHALIP
jgi:capsular exopolysaccharide synthesis family protein